MCPFAGFTGEKELETLNAFLGAARTASRIGNLSHLENIGLNAEHAVHEQAYPRHGKISSNC